MQFANGYSFSSELDMGEREEEPTRKDASASEANDGVCLNCL